MLFDAIRSATSGLTRSLAGAALLLVAVAVAAPGCALEGAEVQADESELTAPGGQLGPALFRNDFFTHLKDGGYSEDQIRELVLLPTERAIDPKLPPVRGSAISAYDTAFASLTPNDFYEQGRTTPFAYKHGVDAGLRQRPVHIVVVPGIFSELISVTPFEELFRKESTARTTWRRALASHESSASSAHLTKDKQFSTIALGDVERSMGDLVRVGSIDDADGTPLVTVTYLKPEIGSLESFGTLDDNVDYYLPRLEKYFKIAGLPEHLYVMGYSRGAAVASNLVSRAAKRNASWMPNLKGVIGLAGVIYGSPVADAVTKPGPSKALIDATSAFVDDHLVSCPGGKTGTPTPALVAANVGHWTAYLVRTAFLLPRIDRHGKELAREGLDTSHADIGSLVGLVRRGIFSNGVPFAADEDDASAATGIFRLDAPIADYCENVERMKVAARQIIKGLHTITTNERLAWWRTHTIPTNVPYFALTATMGDATAEGERVAPLAVNAAAYDSRSLDFRTLRSSYYELFSASHNELQDGQVPLQRARFWPELNTSLNPSQGRLTTYFMGTIGIDHWAIAFPHAFPMKGRPEGNPYPRTLLLKSIGTFVSQVEERTR